MLTLWLIDYNLQKRSAPLKSVKPCCSTVLFGRRSCIYIYIWLFDCLFVCLFVSIPKRLVIISDCLGHHSHQRPGDAPLRSLCGCQGLIPQWVGSEEWANEPLVLRNGRRNLMVHMLLKRDPVQSHLCLRFPIYIRTFQTVFLVGGF